MAYENGIPISEFVRLLKQAEQAATDGDQAQIESINAALKKVDMMVIVLDGKVLLSKIVRSSYYGPG